MRANVKPKRKDKSRAQQRSETHKHGVATAPGTVGGPHKRNLKHETQRDTRGGGISLPRSYTGRRHTYNKLRALKQKSGGNRGERKTDKHPNKLTCKAPPGRSRWRS